MTKEHSNHFTRRGAIGVALAGIGGLGGWAIQRLRGSRGGSPALADQAKDGENPYAYDISQYEKTDPEDLLFEPVGEFDPGFQKVKRIATAPGNRLMVAGDKELRFFTTEGELLQSVPLTGIPHCMHLSSTGELFIGYARHLDVHDSEGVRQHSTEQFSSRSFITSIATQNEAVFVADAGNREVILCDRMGTIEKRFGKLGADDDNPGFAVPSPYFDLIVDGKGNLRIINPGRLRVETYTTSGHFVSSWGEPGMALDRFSGCCNPVFFAMTTDGGFITSEKGLTRIKVHDAKGEFLGLVAGPDFLVDDKALARKEAKGGRAGTGFDIAISEEGWVHALDPFRKTIRSFRPLS